MHAHLGRWLVAGTMLAVSAIAVPARALESGASSDPCFWQTVHWAELSKTQQELLSTIGWTAEKWESDNPDDYPPSEQKTWADLSDAERLVNEALGQTEESWDHPAEGC